MCHHVTGQELLEGIRQYALQQYGPMTVTVFEEWGVNHCRDFGEIVFNMVESGLLQKTETDTRNDFSKATILPLPSANRSGLKAS